jgi:hypothetical protein
VKIIATRSSAPLSRAIRWALDIPVSHLAIVFDNKIVFHANLLGAHVEWYNTFKRNAEIVLEVDIPGTLKEEEEAYQGVINKLDGKPYDYLYLLSLAWRVMLKRAFGLPMPERFLQDPNGLLCTEIYYELPAWVQAQARRPVRKTFNPYLILCDYLGLPTEDEPRKDSSLR